MKSEAIRWYDACNGIFFFFPFVHKQGQHLNKQPPGQGAAPVYLGVGGLCSDWSHLCRVSGAQLSPLVLPYSSSPGATACSDWMVGAL